VPDGPSGIAVFVGVDPLSSRHPELVHPHEIADQFFPEKVEQRLPAGLLVLMQLALNG
jgi:hypothetical protein